MLNGRRTGFCRFSSHATALPRTINEQASVGLLLSKTVSEWLSASFFNIQEFKKRPLPTISVGVNGGDDASTCPAQCPHGGGSRAVCCATTCDSCVPKNLSKMPNYEINTVVRGLGGGHRTRPGSSCGIPGDSGTRHARMAGGWPFPVPRAPVSHSSSHVSLLCHLLP